MVFNFRKFLLYDVKLVAMEHGLSFKSIASTHGTNGQAGYSGFKPPMLVKTNNNSYHNVLVMQSYLMNNVIRNVFANWSFSVSAPLCGFRKVLRQSRRHQIILTINYIWSRYSHAFPFWCTQVALTDHALASALIWRKIDYFKAQVVYAVFNRRVAPYVQQNWISPQWARLDSWGDFSGTRQIVFFRGTARKFFHLHVSFHLFQCNLFFTPATINDSLASSVIPYFKVEKNHLSCNSMQIVRLLFCSLSAPHFYCYIFKNSNTTNEVLVIRPHQEHLFSSDKDLSSLCFNSAFWRRNYCFGAGFTLKGFGLYSLNKSPLLSCL